jgi:hypothetical protein
MTERQSNDDSKEPASTKHLHENLNKATADGIIKGKASGTLAGTLAILGARNSDNKGGNNVPG